MSGAARLALITGGNGQLGGAIARSLASSFDVVAIHWHSQRRRAEAVARAVKDAGGQPLLLQGDCARGQDVRRLAVELAQFGRVEAVVHCVGAEGELPGIDLFELTEAEIESNLAVNLKSAILMAQVFGAAMQQEGGALVYLSSVAAIHPLPTNVHYVAAKSGLVGLVRALAVRFAPAVRVNAIAPGMVGDGMYEWLAGTQEEQVLRATPLGRPVTPAAIAAVARLLCAKGVPITGQTIVVDSGLSLQHMHKLLDAQPVEAHSIER